MFDNFCRFVGLTNDKSISSVETFLSTVSGKSFCNGMFRFFESSNIQKWNEIVTEYFIEYRNNIEVLCYDWLGRVFAFSKFTNTIVFFEPGTGDVYNTDATIERFFDYEVVEYTNDCFASDFFNDWYSSVNEYKLASNECASYIVPLFLSGTDSLDNLEVCDMEVHWEIMKVAHEIGN